MGKTQNRSKKKGFFSSLRFKIGFFYALLATVNIIFFSVMIFENQTDLLLSNFKYHSRDLVNTVLGELSTVPITAEKDSNYTRLVDIMQSRGVNQFVIFDREGHILHRFPESEEKPGAPEEVSADLKRKSLELGSSTTLIRARYNMELNTNDFSVRFLLPLTGGKGEQVFLSTSISVEAIRERLRELYFQIGIAVIWGILFHLLFALFVYRIIFVRVGILKTTSEKMAGGNLAARAQWKGQRNDELDDLGDSFNSMATEIETQVATITRLNEEIQNELEIGKEVQQLFLPEKPHFQGYDMSIYYRPMREVSGDIYNFYPFRNGYEGFFFADATGHGVSAALITTITIMSLDDVVQKNLRPNRILSELNNILSDRLQASFFATGVFLLFDAMSKRIYYSNAGHNAPLFIRPSTGQIAELEKCGPPLGMMEDFEYEARLIKTRPGDRLLVYSDGLVESKNTEGEQFNLDRVKEILLKNIHKSNEEVNRILSETLGEFTEEFQDDVSMLLLEIPE